MTWFATPTSRELPSYRYPSNNQPEGGNFQLATTGDRNLAVDARYPMWISVVGSPSFWAPQGVSTRNPRSSGRPYRARQSLTTADSATDLNTNGRWPAQIGITGV